MIYLEEIQKQEITNQEKEVLNTLTMVIQNVLHNITSNNQSKNSKEVLFQYVIENVELV